MTTTKGPNGPVVLKVRVRKRGHRTGTQTTDPGVDAVIGKLDRRGHWWWLRETALWQDPAILSENEQLAVVLNELADPDHPEHSGTSVITSTLGAAGVRQARDASASQGRLTERSWRFWSREAGLDPDNHPAWLSRSRMVHSWHAPGIESRSVPSTPGTSRSGQIQSVRGAGRLLGVTSATSGSRRRRETSRGGQ